ncbi:MAG: hypothetical protein IT372_41330 [Polyangiaceae bacterium]|nr:hypothetical protein [Polyangiaceae bacterium]
MRALAAEFFSRHPGVSLAALGARDNAGALDLAPFGCPARYLAAEERPDLAERYRAENLASFPGELALPGWVLSDLYLLPGAIGLLLDRDEAIAAAYFAAPTVTPGLFIGVSLFSRRPGIQAGAWIKALTLKMMKARRLRGVAQWSSPSLRVHTRMGPLRVVGAVPGIHELRARSFVYESDLADDASWQDAMARRSTLSPTRRIHSADSGELGRLLDRAEAGERIMIPPPGLDPEGHVLVREGGD